MGQFDGKVVWITGGGSGIGKALALRFASQGAAVAVSGRRPEALDEVVAEIERDGGKALAVPCDVTRKRDVSRAVKAVVDGLGSLDVTVANAGYAAMGRIETLDIKAWRKQFETNVFGLVLTAQGALPQLRESRGRLVLMGSVAAFVALPKGGAYSASKHAVRAIGETLSMELAGSGVTCTTVHPAYVESDIVNVDAMGEHAPDIKDKRPRKLIWKADDAAREIVKGVHARKREVVLSAYGKAAVGLSRLTPSLMPVILGGGKKKGGGRSVP